MAKNGIELRRTETIGDDLNRLQRQIASSKALRQRRSTSAFRSEGSRF
jgi:molybdopterin-biosynthesis enzyme MoeA-like protein